LGLIAKGVSKKTDVRFKACLTFRKLSDYLSKGKERFDSIRSRFTTL